ncbi:MAG: HemK/PrmC family methyltransferase [Rhodanobacter sp.]
MTDLYQVLRDRLMAGLDVLPDKPEENADSTLRALWYAAAGAPRSAAAATDGDLPTLDPGTQVQALEQLITRRLAGEPLAYITGYQRFMGLEMLSSQHALIPRAETEQLARACIALLQEPTVRRNARVIDVCTGSGNLAFAIADQIPDAHVVGTDLSLDAIDLAKRNAVSLGMQGKVSFRTGDLLAPFETAEFIGNTDLIVSNPPYITSTKLNQTDLIACAPSHISSKVERMAAEIAAHEPRLAFDGGPFGISILMRLIEDAPHLLCGGGWLAFEVGLGQGHALTKRLESNPAWQQVRPLADANSATRVILAQRV